MCFCHQAVEVGSGQRAVMLCGWEGNRGPGNRNGSLSLFIYLWAVCRRPGSASNTKCSTLPFTFIRAGLTIRGLHANIRRGPQPPHHVGYWQCPTRWCGCHPPFFCVCMAELSNTRKWLEIFADGTSPSPPCTVAPI